MRLFQNRSDRVRWTHYHNRLRPCSPNGVNRSANIRGLPLVGAYLHWLRTMRFKRLLYAFQHRSAESVFRVDDADTVISEFVPDPIDLLTRLVIVGRTHVHNP